MNEVAQESTQYLNMYYQLKIGSQDKLDIFLMPDLPFRTCTNNCSNKGDCQNLQCRCQIMTAGCQFDVVQLQNKTQCSESLQSHQTQVVAIFYQQDQLIDDQEQEISKFKSSQSIDSKIYLFQPFQYSASNLIEDKLIYNGLLTSTPLEIDFSNEFEKYHIQVSYYSFVLVLKNIQSQKQDIILYYQLLDNNQKFQDFILVTILSVISFIILLIIIYIVRRRYQYLSQSNTKENQEEQSDNIIIQLMPIVNPVKDLDCVICLDPLDNKQTPCKHIMHDNCLKQ